MKKIIFLSFVVLCLLSCSDSGVEPLIVQPPKPDLSKISITQTDFNRFNIKSEEQIINSDNSISKVNLKIRSEFDSLDISFGNSALKKSNDRYLNFEFDFQISNYAYEFNTEFSFEYSDSSILVLDSTISTIYYPYKDVSVLVHFKDVQDYIYGHFQDIYVNENKLYFRPMGPRNIWEYDLTTKEKKEILLVGSGDHLAISEKYLFYDYGAMQLKRHNFEQGITDLEGESYIGNIVGMEVSNDKLYVVLSYYDKPYSLVTYDFELNKISSIELETGSIYHSIDGNYLYGNTWKNNTSYIVKYELNTGKKVAELLAPAKSIDGHSIYDNKLYYTDYNKRLIGYISLDKLKVVQ